MYNTCTKTHDKNYLEKWKNRLQLNTCMVWDVIFFLLFVISGVTNIIAVKRCDHIKKKKIH